MITTERHRGEIETTTEESVRIAETLCDALNAHDLDRVEALASESLLVEAPVGSSQRIGRKGARAWAATYFKAFPDAKWIKERVFGQDNRFVVEIVFSGTQVGSFEGAMRIPPTNKAVRVPAAIVGTAQEGRIQSFRFIWDQRELLDQLGLRPKKP